MHSLLMILYILGGFCYNAEVQFDAGNANNSVNFSRNAGQQLCRRIRGPSMLALFRIGPP